MKIATARVAVPARLRAVESTESRGKRAPKATERCGTASATPEWVFGYASLVADAEARVIGGQLTEPRRAVLRGFERRWCAAADNRAAINDSRHYVDPATGERPDVAVAFLSIVPTPGGCCEGLAIPVDADGLRELDDREINYRRTDVTAEIEPAPPGRVWTYVGLDEAADRFLRARAAGRLYACSAYRTEVEEAFAAAGESWNNAYHRITGQPGCPELELSLVTS